MAATSRETLRSDATILVGAQIWTGTATGGSATTLIHTGNGGIRDSGLSAFWLSGVYALLSSGSDDGNWRQVPKTGYTPSSGTLAFNEAFSTGPSNGVTYELLTYLDPAQWNAVISDALQKLSYTWRSPITLVTDGDMETSGVTNWTASNATLTKVTSGEFIRGTQALRVANSSANGYAQSASIPCQAGQSFFVWANYKSISGTARLRAWDVTNAASINVDTGADAGTNNEGGSIFFGFTAPATCRNVAIRLIGDESTADIYWDDVIVMRSGRRRYVLPSWIESREMITEFQLRTGNRPFEHDWRTLWAPNEVEEALPAVDPLMVTLPDGTPRPIYVEGIRPYASLATDAATTTCPREWAKYAIASEALMRYGNELEDASQNRLQDREKTINSRFSLLSRRLMPRRTPPIGFKHAWVGTVGSPW